MPLPRHVATRYLTPLREGGSMPAVVDTDGGRFVMKFRGAGQGAKALLAELLVGGLAVRLGLPVPALALLELPSSFGRSEPDPEIQEVLRKSEGLNVGLAYLDGAFNFDLHAAGSLVSEELASRIVWLDALATNPDRTARNPNLLVWRRTPWLIDHGAALYAHHDWAQVDEARTRTPFARISDHVLLPQASAIREADAALAPRLDAAAIEALVADLPDELLADEEGGPAAARARYRGYLEARLAAPRAFVDEAVAARERLLTSPPRPLRSRR